MTHHSFNSKPGSPSTQTTLHQAASQLYQAVLDFVYPPACPLCEREIAAAAQTSAFCDDCLRQLAPSQETSCRRCGAPVGPYTIADKNCILCRREQFAFDEVIRLGLYQDELRVACLKAKNPEGMSLAQGLADLLLDGRTDSFLGRDFDVVIPVPEHWLRRFTRNHYAAETIARQLSTRLNVRLATGILAKHRWTPKQAKSPPVQRRQQQQNAFCALKDVLHKRTVLLVDDILTTGATTDAAARALKRAGASRVIVAVVAVSPPRV